MTQRRLWLEVREARSRFSERSRANAEHHRSSRRHGAHTASRETHPAPASRTSTCHVRATPGRYAESLADEMGLYSSDTARIALYARAPTGMVVDPGIHAMGWARDSAHASTSDRFTRRCFARDRSRYQCSANRLFDGSRTSSSAELPKQIHGPTNRIPNAL